MPDPITDPITGQPHIVTPEAKAEAAVKVALTNPAAIPAKFKDGAGVINVDALTASYLEFERKQSERPDPTPSPSPSTSDPSSANSDSIPSSAPATEAQTITDALSPAPVVDTASLLATAEAELATVGVVSEATLAAIATQAPSLVKMFASGAEARKTQNEKAAVEVCGSPEDYAATKAWCMALPEAEKAALLPHLNGPAAETVLRGLDARRRAANPVSGQVTTTTDPAIPSTVEGEIVPFEGALDQTAAMADKRYRTDPEYRRQVDRRLQAGAGIPKEFMK